MASQTITGPDLQYTQDNKHCFAYSGNQTLAGGVFLKQLDFNTNSEYVLGAFTWGTDETSSTRDVYIKILFNEIIVFTSRWDTSNQYPIKATPLPLVIPPFTHVECYQKNDGNTLGCFILTGKVGMPQRVRN